MSWAVTCKWVLDYFNSKIGTSIVPVAGTENLAVNSEWVLKVVDKINGGATSWGTSEYATHYAVDDTFVIGVLKLIKPRFFATGAYINSLSQVEHGYVLHSYDGLSWVSKEISDHPMNYITYGNGKYIAVGNNGKISYSVDLKNWTNVTSGTTNGLLGVAYGNGLFVAVGASGIVAYSSNALTWSSKKVGSNTKYAVTYGGGKFVAVGLFGETATSTDGINWTTGNMGTSFSVLFINFINGIYISGGRGYFSTSTTGSSWSVKSFDTIYRGAAYANGKYVIVGTNGYTATSTDGINWTLGTSGFTGQSCSLTYDKKFFLPTTTSEYDTEKSSIFVSETGQTYQKVFDVPFRITCIRSILDF